MDSSSIFPSLPTKQCEQAAEHQYENMRTKVLPRSHLKSNIPKPVPYIRIPREPRSKSCSSSCFKRSATSVCVPKTPIRSHSHCAPTSDPHHLRCRGNQSRLPPDGSFQSKTALCKSGRSQYSKIKARIDNSTPISLLLKCQGFQSKDYSMRHNTFVNDQSKDNNEIKESSQVDDRSNHSSVDGRSRNSSVNGDKSKDSSIVDSRSKHGSLNDDRDKIKNGFHNDQKDKDDLQIVYKRREFVEEPPGDQVSKTNPLLYVLGKENKSLTAYSDSDSCPSSIKLHFPEGDAGNAKKKDFFGFKEGDKSCFLKECARGFLSSFEKQMEEVSESWLQFICEMIVTKMTIGKSVLPPLSLGGSKLSPRDEITKFFQNLPTQGELLYSKLCNVEEEQMNTLQVVVQNIVALMKEHEGLKRKYSQLQETCERSESQLKTELAILSQENKELAQKYMSVIEKYELERSKTEEQEEHQVAILKKMLELRNVTKHVEVKCKELEKRGERMDTNRQKLEEWIKHLETNHEKENKKYEDLIKKHAEAKTIISQLRQEIQENKSSKTYLDEKVKELQDEITDLKAALENSKNKRAELEKEVLEKNKKIKELEMEIDTLKTNKKELSKSKPSTEENSLELVKDLVNDVEKRNMQIQELKKKINRLEHMLREKSIREEKLLTHVTKLNKKYTNGCISLNNQIKELQSFSKGLQSQVSELEKVLGQKTLELDQRDRHIKELKEFTRLKNEPDFPMCESRKPLCPERLPSGETEKEVFLSRHKRMIQMFSLLEQKQMEIMKLENRLWGLQKTQNHERKTEKEQKESKSIDGVE